MSLPRIYKQPEGGRLFDGVIQPLQDGLGGLPWLDHVFGRCERLVKNTAAGHRAYTPNVYLGGDEYLLLTPDNKELGNYCFFVMEEPQVVKHRTDVVNRLHSPFSLVVWVDMRRVDVVGRDTEAVKEDVLRAVGGAFIRRGGVTIERIYERAENVFQGFTLDEVDNQFLMAPYWGMRLRGEMYVDESCETLTK